MRPKVDDIDFLILRLRSFTASLIDEYQDSNVTEPSADGFVEDDPFLCRIGELMQQNQLRFVTYIVEKEKDER